MLRAAIAFFVLGLIAWALGATGFAGLSMEIGRVLIVVFLVLAVISALIGLFTGRGGPRNIAAVTAMLAPTFAAILERSA